VRIRQQNLTSEEHRYTVRATTILVTSVPDNFLDVNTLKQLFSVFPGGVKNVFLNRDCSELLDEVEQRDKIAAVLENAETELIVKANKVYQKAQKKKEKEAKKEAKKKSSQPTAEGVIVNPQEDTEAGIPPDRMVEFECLAEKYLPKKKRPTYRIPIFNWMPSLPLIGKKVDPPHIISNSRLIPSIGRGKS
jgi:calcium permeable stress-gated cation channel